MIDGSEELPDSDLSPAGLFARAALKSEQPSRTGEQHEDPPERVVRGDAVRQASARPACCARRARCPPSFPRRQSPHTPQSPECRSADDRTGTSRADQRARRSMPLDLRSYRSSPDCLYQRTCGTIFGQRATRLMREPRGLRDRDHTILDTRACSSKKLARSMTQSRAI